VRAKGGRDLIACCRQLEREQEDLRVEVQILCGSSKPRNKTKILEGGVGGQEEEEERRRKERERRRNERDERKGEWARFFSFQKRAGILCAKNRTLIPSLPFLLHLL